MDYKEYLNQIIRFNGDKDLLLMREKYNNPSTLKWHEYKELIACSAVSTILEPIWCLEGTYYDYQPEKNAHQVRFHNANEEELLLSFWEENEEGLTALMQGLPPHEKKDIQCILDALERRDTSKYMVYYNNKCISVNSLDNVHTVWCIANKWVKLQQRTVSLEELNKVFPRQISHYYDSGRWYQHLFVEKGNCTYDGENGNKQKVPDDCWDIDRGGKYDILLNYPPMSWPPRYGTLLKVWRRDDTEAFIKYAMSKPEFKDKLSVVKER